MKPVTLALGTLVALLTACQNTPNDLTDDDLNDTKDVFVRETEASVISMSLADTVLTVGFDAPEARVQTATLSSVSPLGGLPAGCRTVIAGSLTDSDGDGVPDDVTFQFDPDKCRRSYVLFPNITRSLSGQVRLQDVTPQTKDGSYKETSTNFTFTEAFKGETTSSEVRNGTRSLVALSALSLTRDNDMNTTLERRFLADARLVNRMRFAFTSAGGAVAINQALPKGTLEVTGTVQAARNTNPLQSYTVTTESALQYDPDCNTQRLVGGAVVLRSSRGALRITFQACGSAPTAARIL
jgi:hypothetical protein